MDLNGPSHVELAWLESILDRCREEHLSVGEISICAKVFGGDREIFSFSLPGIPDSVRIACLATGLYVLADYSEVDMPKMVKVMTSVDQVIGTMRTLAQGMLCENMVN